MLYSLVDSFVGPRIGRPVDFIVVGQYEDGTRVRDRAFTSSDRIGHFLDHVLEYRGYCGYTILATWTVEYNHNVEH